jgi:polyisoprenoid-binding protein YceI
MTTAPASRRGPILVSALIAVLLVAGGGIWYLFFRPAGPAPVSLGSGTPATAAPTMAATQGAGASDAPPTDAPSSDPAATAAAPGASAPAGGDGIAGTWTVDPSVGSFADFSGSFVGYRVKETLASIGATEAVGRTPDVTGSVTIEGTSITAATFTADLTGLRSDDDRRDGQLRRQALETGQFPQASFVLTTPVDLGSVPAEGARVEVTATGDLTLHGVTTSVQIPLEARLAGGVVTVAGSLPIAFADYSITPPSSMIVLSVEDKGVLELQLQLTRR